jgi:hypothetical protein
MTLWTFEVLQTIPAEYRIYKAQFKKTKTPGTGTKLFIAVRYLGTAAMITSAVGYFGRGYSAHFCVGYQRVAPLFKVFSALANQAVFLWRTYAISGRRKWVLVVMSVAYFCAMVLQFFGNATTVPASSGFGNCLAGPKPGFRVSWVFYLAAMLYDFLVISISWYFLAGSAGLSWRHMYGFTRALLTEGIAYVMLATLMNAINLTFFELPVATTVQGMFATMGIAVTSLASQRILLHLLDPDNHPNRVFKNSGGYPSDTHGNLEFGAVRTIGGGMLRGGRTTDSLSRNIDPDLSVGQVEMDRMQVAVHVDVERDADFSRDTKKANPYR